MLTTLVISSWEHLLVDLKTNTLICRLWFVSLCEVDFDCGDEGRKTAGHPEDSVHRETSGDPAFAALLLTEEENCCSSAWDVLMADLENHKQL